MKIFGNEVLYLQIYTGLIYSITITLIGIIVKNLTNKFYGLFAIISLFLIYPIPLKPWPIYNCYFFYTLSLFFYIKDNKKYKLFSGFCLSLAYLSFTTVYNFVLPLLFFLLIFYYLVFLKKNKNELFKLFYFLVGSFVPILIFYIYLIINNIFGTWFTYQKIPILGVCLGHQAIGETFGCNIKKHTSVVHGKTSLICHDKISKLYNGIPDKFDAYI